MIIPLSAIAEGEAVPLYTSLEEELARSPRNAMQIVVDDKTGLPLTYEVMNDRHRAICDKAGLPKKMTFTGFRHGGTTELGDAGIADVRPITGHTQLQTTGIYNHNSEEKARSAGLKRVQYVKGMK